MSGFMIGIDVGGTNTDAVVVDVRRKVQSRSVGSFRSHAFSRCPLGRQQRQGSDVAERS